MPRALVALFGRLYDMHARDLDVEVPSQRSNLGNLRGFVRNCINGVVVHILSLLHYNIVEGFGKVVQLRLRQFL